MSRRPDAEPPDDIRYDLDAALLLLAALEDARDALTDSRHLTVVADIEDQVRLLNRRLGFADPEGLLMADAPLRASAAARRLGMPTAELLRLIHDRELRYVMVDGIAHVPEDAITEYKARAS